MILWVLKCCFFALTHNIGGLNYNTVHTMQQEPVSPHLTTAILMHFDPAIAHKGTAKCLFQASCYHLQPLFPSPEAHLIAAPQQPFS